MQLKSQFPLARIKGDVFGIGIRLLEYIGFGYRQLRVGLYHSRLCSTPLQLEKERDYSYVHESIIIRTDTMCDGLCDDELLYFSATYLFTRN